MTSSSNHGHAIPASARSRTPALLSHFFRIIVDHEVHSKKLSLPRKYARFSFGTKAILETPSVNHWEVDVTRDSDGISWFSGRWNAFYEFYSITYGHLLLFRNIGSSRFSVVIFDLSACEIEYPIHDPVSANPRGGSDSKQILNNPPGITPVILEKGGNVWEARAYLNGNKYVYISWQKFARSNSITSEDTCYFELLATVPLIRFRVTVFKEV
ncbi:B3 domain-containing protein At1g49475 [Linum perenne]